MGLKHLEKKLPAILRRSVPVKPKLNLEVCSCGDRVELEDGRKVYLVHTRPQLKEFQKRIKDQEEHGMDTETNSLRCLGENKDFKVVGASFSWGIKNSFYIPINHYFDDDLNLPQDLVAEVLNDVYSDRSIQLDGCNLKFDKHVMKRLGVDIRTPLLNDIMYASFLCDENREQGLKPNVSFFFGYKMQTFEESLATVSAEDKKSVGLKANNKATYDLVRVMDCLGYTTDDALFPFRLKNEIYFGGESLLEEEEMLDIYYQMYRPILLNVFEMEERGCAIDLKCLTRFDRSISKDLEELKYKIFETLGMEINLNSNQQLAQLFFGSTENIKNPDQKVLDKSFGFKPLSFTAKGAPQTSTAVFEALAKLKPKDNWQKVGVDICKVMGKYSSLEKLKTAFVDGIRDNIYDDGKVHCNFKITGTDSGRFSCSEPNFQQLKKNDDEDPDAYNIREIVVGSFIPGTKERYKIMSCDYSSLEMRINTNFSGDQKLIDMIESGVDPHSYSAKNTFGLDCKVEEVKKKYPILRAAGKTFNFCIGYGGGSRAVYDLLVKAKVDPEDPKMLKEFKCKKGKALAQKFIDLYFEAFYGLKAYMNKQIRKAHANLEVLTVLGRKRRLPLINSSSWVDSGYAERLSVNAPTQGTAADITINAQNRIAKHKRLKELDCHMLLQIHDEVVFELPESSILEASAIIKELMENPFEDLLDEESIAEIFCHVPMQVEPSWGDNYAQAK